MRRTLTTIEAAFVLKIDPCTLRKYADKKNIFCLRDGVNGWRKFPITEVERFAKVLDGIQEESLVK